MSKLVKTAMCALVLAAGLGSVGCATVEKLEADARADRAAHPGKYTEIPEVRKAQMTQNESGAAYPAFCTFGCKEQTEDLTRAW
ncbi:hypothetical protein D3C77_587030 [compost metagenome]